MRFYKLTTPADMRRAEIHFESTIPLGIRVTHQQVGQAAAAKRWSNQSSITLNNANAKLREFQSFKDAFTDFLAGKPVYTDY